VQGSGSQLLLWTVQCRTLNLDLMSEAEILSQLRRRFADFPFDCGTRSNPGVMDAEEWRDWTGRETSPDQRRIEDYLGAFNLDGKRILHVGAGNSGLARRLAGRAREIVATTVVEAEAKFGAGFGIPNYRVMVHNKFAADKLAVGAPFDFIVDNNPTSFCCCLRHLAAAVEFYASHLGTRGQLVTDRAGLRWTPVTNPGWGFSVEDFVAVAALAGLSCYRINRDTIVFARQAPEKPPLLWRAVTGLRKLGRSSARRLAALKKSHVA